MRLRQAGIFSGSDIRYALAERSHRKSACKGRNGESRFPGEFLHFFIYDVIKIFVLLAVLIFLISYIQSYFHRREVRRLWEDSMVSGRI